MIQDWDYYEFGIDNDGIRNLVPNLDLTDDDCEQVAYALEEDFEAWIARAALRYRLEHPRESDAHVSAHVTLQDENDYGYFCNARDVHFDARFALDAIDLCYLPPHPDWFHGRGWCDYGDDIYFAARRLGIVPDHDGPFDCYVDDDAEYAAYLDARVRSEYGVEPREA